MFSDPKLISNGFFMLVDFSDVQVMFWVTKDDMGENCVVQVGVGNSVDVGLVLDPERDPI